MDGRLKRKSSIPTTNRARRAATKSLFQSLAKTILLPLDRPLINQMPPPASPKPHRKKTHKVSASWPDIVIARLKLETTQMRLSAKVRQPQKMRNGDPRRPLLEDMVPVAILTACPVNEV
jgi:hypothetical protein